jgi:hypothetical protein
MLSYTLSMKRICLIALGQPVLDADEFSIDVSGPHFFSAPNSMRQDSHVFTGLANLRNPHPSSPFFILRVTSNDAKIVQGCA